jgi:hypothetical protein
MHPDLERLSGAAAGLFFISETDAPLDAIECPDKQTPPEAWVRQLAGGAPGTPVEIQEVDYFFRNQVREDEAGTSTDRERAKRFHSLMSLIHQVLPDAKVYRTGSVQVDAFVIGRLQDGTLGGLRTKLVET